MTLLEHRALRYEVRRAPIRAYNAAPVGPWRVPMCSRERWCQPAPTRAGAVVAGGPEGAPAPLTESTELPDDLTVGDLVAVAGTGAYHHHRDPFVGRPPVLGVGDALVRTLVRRETIQALLRRAT